MKVKFERAAFAEAFLLAGSIAGSKNWSVLDSVRLDVLEGVARLIGADGELQVVVELPLSSGAEGQCLLHAAKVGAILREATSEQVEIEVGEVVQITAGRSVFKLQAGDPKEFPVFECPGKLSAVYSAAVLADALRKTVFAVDEDSTRFALGGVRIDDEAAVATDGRRLAVVKLGATVRDSQWDAIIPARAVAVLLRAMSGGDAVLSLSGNRLVVKCGNKTVSTLLVEGRYPKWQQVIPDVTQGWESFSVNAGVLLSAVRQAAIVADKESRGLQFLVADGVLSVGAKAADIGTSSVDVPITWVGESVEMRLDWKFVSDFCKVLSAEEVVEVHVADSTKPVLFESGEYRYVVMPMAIDK